MSTKLYDAERKVMDVLWSKGDVTAKHLAEILRNQVGWSKTTTYTMVKRCIDKGVIERVEPRFICRPLVTREQVREYETSAFIDRMYDGAADQLVASILGSKILSPEEIARLKQMIGSLE